MQLTDQQKESLASAIGQTLKTLRTIYDRCMPEEKRRPIEEAIDEMLFKTFQPQKPETSLTPDLAQLAQKLEKLTVSQQDHLLKELKGYSGSYTREVRQDSLFSSFPALRMYLT
ncbi:hypothetical protein [Coleofasciculus sp. FACHB-SPT9]|uniref:hypothetical protein n=1 Tax=Cyanophyceae TaxID=3028117 RepID=UPI0016863B7D|nr:hypothetical protein [Coleofasciculus sp. FACHB-SPT9]MBD1889882.1 hypothetical protein [Coleofasciculus sp. FACHB-SPT9]